VTVVSYKHRVKWINLQSNVHIHVEFNSNLTFITVFLFRSDDG